MITAVDRKLEKIFDGRFREPKYLVEALQDVQHRSGCRCP
jgi:hypothetical protein